MTRISSLFVAATLAILPISAFAQQNPTPAKAATPPGVTIQAPAVTAPVASKETSNTTAKVTESAKPVTKTSTHGMKTAMHGMKPVHPHHAKPKLPAKS